MPGSRPRVSWVARWAADRLPDADALVATAWQSAPVVAAAPPRCGARFYFVQHYESLYHGEPAVVDATYRLPLAKIVISTWLRDVMRERFDSGAEVLVTPVDRSLFRRVPGDIDSPRPRVLMLHHDYEWKGVAGGLEAGAPVKRRMPAPRPGGFGVKPPRGPVGHDEFHPDPPPARLAAIYSGRGTDLCPPRGEGL